MEILAIIPARGGSKRIPNKNIIPLLGKPLISYSIETAIKSKFITRVIVSTDSKKIADVAKTFGAEIFIRDNKLAKDDTGMIPVLVDLIKDLKNKENYFPDIVLLLQPTSPLRIVEDIDCAIKFMIKNKIDSVQAYTKIRENPAFMAKIDKDSKIVYIDKKNHLKRSQDLSKYHISNGALFLVKTKYLYKDNTIYSNDHRAYIMPQKRSIDIDEYSDLNLAEFYLRERKNG